MHGHIACEVLVALLECNQHGDAIIAVHIGTDDPCVGGHELHPAH